MTEQSSQHALPWLSESELESLTKKKRPTAQVRALNSLMIDHRLRPDGSVVVLTASLENQPKTVKVKTAEPNMEAV